MCKGEYPHRTKGAYIFAGIGHTPSSQMTANWTARKDLAIHGTASHARDASVVARVPILILYAGGDTSWRKRPGNVANCAQTNVPYAIGDAFALHNRSFEFEDTDVEQA